MLGLFATSPPLAAPPRFRVALEALQPFRRTAGDLLPQLLHDFLERGPKCVIAALGEHIRSGRDEVDVDLKSRAGVLQPDQPDVRLVNLPRAAKGEDLFLHPGIQGGQGGNVQVLHVKSHAGCHSFWIVVFVVRCD